MPRLVMKFGGTPRSPIWSVSANVDTARQARGRCRLSCRGGGLRHGGKDQRTGGLCCREASPIHDAREYDAVVASGEQVTLGAAGHRLCRAWACLHAPGRAGRSRFRRPAPMARHGSRPSMARKSRNIFEERDEVAVVAGLPGRACATRPDRHAGARRLGYQRGGARGRAWRGALRHLYRCGRRLHDRPAHRGESPPARRVSYEEMLEMASLGAKVLQVRSVEVAMVHNVPTYVRYEFLMIPAAPQSRDADLRRGGKSWGTADRHPASPIRGTKRRSPCAASPTSRAWPPRSFVAAGRGEYQCRHDHPGGLRAGGGGFGATTRYHLHRACERLRARQDPARAEPLGDRIRITPGVNGRGQGSRPSGWACVPMPGVGPQKGLQGLVGQGYQHPARSPPRRSSSRFLIEEAYTSSRCARCIHSMDSTKPDGFGHPCNIEGGAGRISPRGLRGQANRQRDEKRTRRRARAFCSAGSVRSWRSRISAQDRLDKIVGADRGQHGRGGLFRLCAARRRHGSSSMPPKASTARPCNLTTMRAGEGLVGQIAEAAQPLALADAQTHPAFAYKPEDRRGDSITASSALPILRCGQHTRCAGRAEPRAPHL